MPPADHRGPDAENARALDRIDVSILDTLARDARASFARIGATVNLSAPAVKRRVDRLRARGVGLWAGVDLDPARGTGRALSERLLARRVLVKDTHGQTVRIAPPLTIAGADLDWGLDQLADALR